LRCSNLTVTLIYVIYRLNRLRALINGRVRIDIASDDSLITVQKMWIFDLRKQEADPTQSQSIPVSPDAIAALYHPVTDSQSKAVVERSTVVITCTEKTIESLANGSLSSEFAYIRGKLLFAYIC